MSHITQAQLGLAAAEARNWDEAITKLSSALQSSSNPAWLIARSKALVGVKRYQEALDDANLAWHAAYQRNKRPLLLEAHHRRAVAYFRMGQYANADCCCVYAMRLAKGQPATEKRDPKEDLVDKRGCWTPTVEDAREEARSDPFNKTEKSMGAAMAGAQSSDGVNQWRLASTLRTQILFAMQKLGQEDPARKVTTSQKPEEKKLADHSSTKKVEATTAATQSGIKQTSTTSAPKPAVPSTTPLRIQEFQSKTTMSVSIFSKGVSKEKLKVDYQPQSVHLSSVVYPDGVTAPFQLELSGEIDPSACKCTVTPNKVELSLAKTTPAMWKSLYSETKKTQLTREGSSSSEAPSGKAPAAAAAAAAAVLSSPSEPAKPAPLATSSPSNTTSTTAATAAQGATNQSSSSPGRATAAASYPTSSKSGPRDWDKVVSENGGDRSDDEEGRDVNFFFKKLFRDATPEQQRAMMKSFTESNGTSLSTDWNDVKDRVVETVPPEGVEAKKWDK